MTATLILPLRWFARPRLAAIAAAAAVLLGVISTDHDVARQTERSATLLIAQATAPDPGRRELDGARALAVLRARPDVVGARIVSRPEIAEWLRQAGVPQPAGDLPAPAVIEARLRAGADRAPIRAAMNRLPGIAIDQSDDEAGSSIAPTWLVGGVAVALLTALAAAGERRSLRPSMALLHQLGLTGPERLRLLLIAGAGSAALGGLGGVVLLLSLGVPGRLLFGPVLATVVLDTATMLPVLSIADVGRR